MPIAVDGMGGDLAPRAAVEGAVRASREHGISILLVGREDSLRTELVRLGGKPSSLEVVHADEVVAMDESAVTPLRRKRNSSLMVCAELVKAGRAQAFVTAGNTGAAMSAAKAVLKTIPGVDRPALAAVLPAPVGRTVLLDVGANASAKPHHLLQFALMGHVFARGVLAIPEPRIGLLSIGEERGKGNDLVRSVYAALAEAGLNFIGNVEGRDLFDGSVDVAVCDGFVGNVALKSAEGAAQMLRRMLREEIASSWRARLGAWLVRPALRGLRRRADPNEYGAAPLLGLEGGCLVAHGSSTALGVCNSVLRAVELVRGEVVERIREGVTRLAAGEVRVFEDGEVPPPEAV